MKLSDEFDDQESNNRLPVIYMTIGIIAFISLVFVVVISINYKKQPHKNVDFLDVINGEKNDKEDEKDPLLEELGIGESTLTSDELDFWNMYKDDDTNSANKTDQNENQNSENKSDSDKLTSAEKIEKNAQELKKQEEEAEKEEDLSEGGTKTKVVRPDGEEQWVMINAYITKNDYKDEGFVYEEPMMKYYVQGDKQSVAGVVLDESCGNVNFDTLKKNGIEFVMLRVGYRGYESGVMNLDTMFDEYERLAQQANLQVGVFFESQAIDAVEASEEAQLVVSMLTDRDISYPVAIKLGVVTNDTSRTDVLAKSQITDISNSFCQFIEESGYNGLVFGNKFWLLRRLDLTTLGDYDIWLSQDGEVPDYPYEFAMWQYKNQVKLDGISKEVPVCISLVDYSKK